MRRIAESKSPQAGRVSATAGFTLIELLIVILIIVLLAGMLTATVRIAKSKAKITEAQVGVDGIGEACKRYQLDEAVFPAYDVKWDGDEEGFNAFPAAFENLAGDPAPKGKGGRNSPYLEVKIDDLARRVDPDTPDADQDPGINYEPIDKADRYDQDVAKYLLDPWGNPYIYRENESKSREDWMWSPDKFDVWSRGPNGLDQSIFGEKNNENGKYDDIFSW